MQNVANSQSLGLNTLRPRQDGRRFADDTFKRISLNDDIGISIKISLNFVPRGSINNIPALVQIMAWRRPGDKPLSEPIMVSLLTHICVTRLQWVKWPDWTKPAQASRIWRMNDPEILASEVMAMAFVLPNIYGDRVTQVSRSITVALHDIKAPHLLPFVREFIDASPHKEPVMRKAFPCRDVTLTSPWITMAVTLLYWSKNISSIKTS